MRTLRLLPVVVLLALSFVTCTNDASAPEPGYATVSGVVTDAYLGTPIPDVTVTGENNQVTTTAADGSFYLKFKVDSLGIANLRFSKQGYRDTAIVADIVVLRSTEVSIYMISKLPYGPAVIRGLLLNKAKAPIPGVTISVSSTISQNTVVSDTNGRYSVSIPVDSTIGNATFAVDIIMHDSRSRYRDTMFTVSAQFGSAVANNTYLTPRAVLMATIGGEVFDGLTSLPLGGVSVTGTVISPIAQTPIVAQTNVIGEYSLSFQVDTISIVRLLVQNSGNRDTTFFVKAIPGSITTLPRVTLNAGVSHNGQGGSGIAQTIAFIDITPPEISVYGVGGKETAVLNWEVRDSLGLPVDAQHSVPLTFAILNGPGQGEYISPSVMTTNSVGRASITFNAGTKSGVAQIQATATVGGRTIQSAPVRVVIDGGYADQTHFTIAPTQHNLPLALIHMNDRWGINVLVGDKYSNPAAASSVYFRTTAGVVQGTNGTVETSKDGQASVQLITGHPFADETVALVPGMDPGYCWVHAQTVGEAGATVQDSTLVLWTGLGGISNVAPASFNIPNQGSQVLTFRVCDGYGHNLAPGTSISVRATIPPPPYPDAIQNKVLVSFGDNSQTVVVPDAMTTAPSPYTDFSALINDGTYNVTQETPFYITIVVSGPNTPTPVSYTIYGVVF